MLSLCYTWVQYSMKICSKCKVEKSLESFHKNRSKKDGLESLCKDCRKEHMKKYREDHEESILEYAEKYRDGNKERIAEYKKKYEKERRKADPGYKLILNLRTRLSNWLKSKKQLTTRELLGCSVQYLRCRLEAQFKEGMTWSNYGTYWHVDHIYPLSLADLNDPGEIKKVCHYTNLQPLEAIENIRKGNSIT